MNQSHPQNSWNLQKIQLYGIKYLIFLFSAQHVHMLLI